MLIIGSRGSQLALWQARWVQGRLASLGIETRIEIIKTTGDRVTSVPLSSVGGKGLFTKEIEEALLARQVDLAVHSLKDLPTEIAAGLQITAIPEREDPREVMCPAVGQGALAIETRDGETICQALDHAATRAAVTAERAVLRSLGGGCLTPIGAHARVEQETLRLMAIVISTDGAQSVRDSAEGPADEAERVGRELGERLLRQGADR